MKRHHILFIASLLVISLGFAFTRVHRTVSKNTEAGKGFALVELYTSEGCSSCPPADKLLAKIAQDYKDKAVYVLAYHVDYWNHLGWKDAFSSPQYSQRQRAYSKYLNLDGVYTPQAIVNGRAEFVGSDEDKMHGVIKDALAGASQVQLSLDDLVENGTDVKVQYHINGTLPANCSLVLAAVERHGESQVTAGENKGRMLPHINIVRALQASQLKGADGAAGLKLPGVFKDGQVNYIGFIQDNATGRILDAQWAAGNLKANVKKPIGE